MKKRVLFLLTLLATAYSNGQNQKDSIIQIQDIIISGKAPISKEKINQKQLQAKNLGQDVPSLLKNNVSVVTTSDAGAGVGYTGMRIRGSDQTRINLTLNGVPINDAESQGPFWSNMPDLVSSLSNITIQRGVGTSMEGSGSFGASINAETQNPSKTAFFQTGQSIGSFNTHKHTFALGTGSFFDNSLRIDGRISFIKSDGYIDRAISDLFSFYANALYQKNNTSINFLVFGGKEQTYQAWNGVDAETLKRRRTFNSCGAIYDSNGNIIDYYNNETDNYRQDHYILSLNQRLSDSWKLKSTLFYTKGKGYYEEYKQNSNLLDYKLDDFTIGNETISKTDLIRRQWMKNDFYGVSNRLIGRLDNWNVEVGLGFNSYNGNHFGKVIWAEHFSNGQRDHEYYRNKADKTEINSYVKALYKIDNWELFGDIQYKTIFYKGHDLPDGESFFQNGQLINFKENYNFINPKLGATYNISKGNLYFTYGIAQKEPSRNDILNNTKIKPELLHNIELGIQQFYNNFSYTANVYGMYYIDQLVLSGKIDDVGTFIRENSGKSYRTGIEISAKYQLTSKFNITANSSASINKNINFKKTVETPEGETLLNLGNTDIIFSPNYTGNLILDWTPIKNISAKWMNQLVSSQFLSNENYKNSKLDGYFTSDVLIEYSPKILNTKEFSFKLLLNNIFNNLYESNGYYSDGKPYYFPQAGFNFLTGVTIKF